MYFQLLNFPDIVPESPKYRVRPGWFAALCDPRWLEVSLEVASEVEGFNSAGIIIPPIKETREIIRSARAGQTWGVNAAWECIQVLSLQMRGKLKHQSMAG